MAQLKVIIEGYVRTEESGEVASSSTTLIRWNGLHIIVDPGMDRGRLLEALKTESLTPDDINYVIVTHYHLDHVLLSGIFEKAKILDVTETYSWDGAIKSHGGKVPGTDIEIIKTPGHDPFHCAVIVPSTQYGTVVVAGDVFWWYNHEHQKTDKRSLMNHADPFLKDNAALHNSRETVLKRADYIVPGHGKMFRVQ
ncbi:MAG: MBL fold metallo-hydrolase [Patescibacteria group bacterium]